MQLGNLPKSKLSVVAVPAHNEARYIGGCLAALALQRDEAGAPIGPGCLEVLIFANNCTDATAAVARRASQSIPHPVIVVEEDMPSGQLNAGWARKRAMDLAAARVAEIAPLHGLILTTDADSRVAPTWFAATMREFEKGIDCVAGYIDAFAEDYIALGDEFVARGRLEDTYLRFLAEINARCDPRLYDPWPNHRVSSGASLAVSLAAYSAIGGLPARPVGEDAALTETLTRAGFKVRHSMDVCVTTSCRFDGRAIGGAADTMRHRHDVPNAPCDAEIETALQATRRSLCKGFLREKWVNGRSMRAWPAALVAAREIVDLPNSERNGSFEDMWDAVCDRSPALRRGEPLRPSDLPRQIAIAKMIVRQLAKPVRIPRIFRGDKRHHAGPSGQAMPVL